MDPIQQEAVNIKIVTTAMTFSGKSGGSLVNLGARKIVALIVDSARDQDSTVL